MKRIILSFLLTTVVIVVFGQVEIFHGSLQEGLAKANREGKQVIAMVSTSWCAPCKMVMEKVLPTKEAGDYINPRYVFLKYIIDKADPDKIADTYGISAFPTYLFLDSTGQEIVRHVGGSNTAEQLIAVIENSMNDPIIELKRKFETEPLKYGSDYIKCLSDKYDFKTLEKTVEHLFVWMDRQGFYEMCFPYLKSGFVDFSYDIAEDMAGNREFLNEKFGEKKVVSVLKKWADSKIWKLVVAEKMDKKDARAYRTILNRLPELKGAKQRFAFKYAELIRKYRINRLLQKTLDEAGDLTAAETGEIFGMVVFLCGKEGMQEWGERLEQVAGQLNDWYKDNENDMYQWIKMLEMKS